MPHGPSRPAWLRPLRASRFEPELELAYQRHLEPVKLRLARQACLLALLLVASFAVLDQWAVPSAAGTVLGIRASLLAFVAGLLVFTWHPAFMRRYELSMSALFLGLGFGVEAMVLVSAPGEVARSVYVGGVMLAVAGIAGLSHLSTRTMALCSGALLAGYLAIAFGAHHAAAEGQWPLALANGVFIASMFIVGTIGLRGRERHARDSFRLKVRLEAELERKEHARRISEHLSNHDALTGLPNRPGAERRIAEMLARARAEGALVALLFADLDGFKDVNDRLGHPAGDEVLRVVAQRIRACLSERDLVARLGGDEFVAALPFPPEHRASIGAVVQRVEAHVAEPIVVDGHSITIGVSVGAAGVPSDGETLERLLAGADSRMYAVKRRHKAIAAAIGADGLRSAA